MRESTEAMSHDWRTIAWRIFKPTGLKVSGCLVSAIFFGGAGLLCYAVFHDFRAARLDLANDAGVFAAYVLAWPVILMGMFSNPLWPEIPNFEPILFERFGWLALSLYYYGAISLCTEMWRWQRNRRKNRENISS